MIFVVKCSGSVNGLKFRNHCYFGFVDPKKPEKITGRVGQYALKQVGQFTPKWVGQYRVRLSI